MATIIVRAGARLIVSISAFLWMGIAPAYATTVTGTVTFLDNEVRGERGDVGARVALIPLPVPHRLTVPEARLDRGISLDRIPGTVTATVDGFGKVEFDNVKPGTYLVFILSGTVTRDPSKPIDAREVSNLRQLYTSNAALQTALGAPFNEDIDYGSSPPIAPTLPPDYSRLRLDATTTILLHVAGPRAHFSWDFGESYS